jgi:hypothetical protein
MHARLSHVGSLLAALVSLVSLGCDSRLEPTTRPVVASATLTAGTESAAHPLERPRGFYPLAVGNRWDFELEVTIQLLPSSGPAEPPLHFTGTGAREITGERVIDGRRYFEERVTNPPDFDFSTNRLYRQDASGLYERGLFFPGSPEPVRIVRAAQEQAARAARSTAEHEAYRLAIGRLAERIAAIDASIGRGPAVAASRPGTAAPGELTRLRYPLELKSRWALSNAASGPPEIREAPLMAEVIGIDELGSTPGTLRAFRIELSGHIGPDGFVHVWYGTSGYLGLAAHVETPVIGWDGTVYGRYLYDSRESLTELSLVTPPSILPTPPWSVGTAK